jgi:hypothetical protein
LKQSVKQQIVDGFITSIKAQLYEETVSYKEFILEHTFLRGRKFSFKNHEYQEYLLDLIQNNPGCIFSVSKCSQIGLSEIVNRLVLARMAVRAGTSALISFPSITFSQEVFKTRFASVIRESSKLSGLINYNNDSASVKEFYNGSIAYALGGSKQSEKSLLNRPIDTILIDEFDRQDLQVIGSYRSRMTHTPANERLIVNISTPTVDGLGIDAQVKDCGIIHKPLMQCPCDHVFEPDYYTHIRIPGFDREISMLTKETAAGLDLSKAYLECPECKGEINAENMRTVWQVTENPKAQRRRIGLILDPFVALGFQPIPDLVEASLDYTSNIEWLNQGLGKVAKSSDSTLDIGKLIFKSDKGVRGVNIFGLDFGKECHWLRGVIRDDTSIHVADTKVVSLGDIEEFLEDEHRKRVFVAGVMDSQPYTDLVYRLIKRYLRVFSAIYISPNPPRPELYSLTMSDRMNETVRQININKSLAMDNFATILQDFFTFEPTVYEAAIAKHFLDMRRVRDYRFDENIYKWEKSQKGRDHFWHTAIYLYIASKLASLGLETVCKLPVLVGKINPELRRQNERRRR